MAHFPGGPSNNEASSEELPLLLWCLLCATTPADGVVVRKLSALLTPDTARSVGFLLLWFLVAIARVTASDALRPRPAHPDAVAIVGAGIWLGVLLFEAGLRSAG